MIKARLVFGASALVLALVGACSDGDSPPGGNANEASGDAAVDGASPPNAQENAANDAAPSDTGASPESGTHTCKATAGCYHMQASQSGAVAGCKGTFQSHGYIEEAADALAKYRDNPACLLDDKEDAGACTTRMLCTEGATNTVAVLTVRDDGRMTVAVDTVGPGGNCHLEVAYTRVDQSNCADAGGGAQ